MSKASKKVRRTKQKRELFSTDVTLEDFANSSHKHAYFRLKKGALNAIQREAQQLQRSPRSRNVADNWFDKDLNDFDIVQTEEEDVEENESDSRQLSRSSKNVSKNLKGSETGCVYPADVWYILSLYIFPEDVCRFASVCRYANIAIHTLTFWRHLYHRYYHELAQLPTSLMPSHLERVHGLRARVIRSLHHMYPPLSSKNSKNTMDEIPRKLIGQRCILQWHKAMPDKKSWSFCFKFNSEPSSFAVNKLCYSKKNFDLLNGYNDLFHNPESGCSVFEIFCQNFTSVPIVMGQVLTQVVVKVSQTMRHHRVKLVFNSRLTGKATPSGCAEENIIILDPVTNWRTMAWWHSLYPGGTLP